MRKNGKFIPNINIEWLNTMTSAIPQKKGVSPCIAICLVMALNYAYITTKSPQIIFNKKLQHQFGLNYRILKLMLFHLEDNGYIKLITANKGKPFSITLIHTPPDSTSVPI